MLFQDLGRCQFYTSISSTKQPIVLRECVRDECCRVRWMLENFSVII